MVSGPCVKSEMITKNWSSLVNISFWPYAWWNTWDKNKRITHNSTYLHRTLEFNTLTSAAPRSDPFPDAGK